VRVYRSEGQAYEVLEQKKIDLGVSARDLIDVTGNPRHVSRGELINLITRREHAGFGATAHQVELYSRVAFPIGTLWLFLIAAPWIISPDRRRSMSVNLGGGVIAIAVMLSADQVFRLMALGRKISPVLGAWGVGLLCLVVIPISWALQRRARIRGSIF
jgi:lipopolysaccharide export system permease protein